MLSRCTISFCNDCKLEINSTKTKIMVFSKHEIDPKTIGLYFGNEELEIVKEYKIPWNNFKK